MANPYRDVIAAIKADLVADVSGASTIWKFFYPDGSGPQTLWPGQACYIWFAGEVRRPTMGDTGHADFLGEYHVLYAEPAADNQGQNYEDATLALEVIYDDVMDSLLSLNVAGTVYQLEVENSRLFGPGEESALRGFEIVLSGARIRARA